jgi:uncharacterized protein
MLAMATIGNLIMFSSRQLKQPRSRRLRSRNACGSVVALQEAYAAAAAEKSGQEEWNQ